MDREYNAVFKGGGAKGLAYAGALGACEMAGIRFKRVAGSSAGAITAALVASGHSASDIARLAPGALRTIENPSSAVWRLRSGSLLRSDSLATWFDEALRVAVFGAGAGAEAPRVTFAALFAEFEIDLFVVAMDLSSRQPIVFSAALTPDAVVTDAVLASSAIPVAFPAARFVLNDEVHRVVDGGTWANYPSFVFLDEEFCAHHGLDHGAGTTIGFILDDGAEVHDPTRHRSITTARGPRFDTDRGSALAEFGPAGAVLSSPSLRLAVAAAPGLLLAIAAVLLIQQGRSGFPVLDAFPPASHNWLIAIVAVVLVLTVPLWLVSTLVTARLGRSVADEGAVGAIAAMGVGPSVPYWIRVRRDSTNHVPVRIPVPPELTTLAFGASPDLIGRAMHAGYVATLGALTSVGLYRAESFPPPRLDDAVQAGPAHEPTRTSWRILIRPLLWLVTWSVRPVGWLLQRFFGVDRAAFDRGLKSFYVVLGVALLAGAVLGVAVAHLVAGVVPVGLAFLIIASAAPLYLLWFLARRKAALAVEPFPVLRRLPAWLLALLALASAVAGGLMVAASSTSAPISHVVAAEPQIGIVGAVFTETDEIAVLVPRTPAELERLRSVFPGSISAESVGNFQEGYDSNGVVVTPGHRAGGVELEPCRGVETHSAGCWLFPRSSADPASVGSSVDLRVHESGLAFIDGVKTNVVMSMLLLSLVVAYAGILVAVAVRCWDVRTWRRSRRSL